MSRSPVRVRLSALILVSLGRHLYESSDSVEGAFFLSVAISPIQNVDRTLIPRLVDGSVRGVAAGGGRYGRWFRLVARSA